jgi:hypothetical protein
MRIDFCFLEFLQLLVGIQIRLLTLIEILLFTLMRIQIQLPKMMDPRGSGSATLFIRHLIFKGADVCNITAIKIVQVYTVPFSSMQ